MSTTPARDFASEGGREAFALATELGDKELRPRAAAAEEAGEFPREVFRTLGRAGLMGLPFSSEYGGAGLCFADYLQVLENLSNAWGSVGLGVSVHTLACLPLSNYGTDEQRTRWLADDLAGERLGAYCLSESDAGSDAAALKASAERSGDGYVVNGTKAWISHGGEADFYVVMARTQDTGAKGISCFLVEATADGVAALPAEHKLGFTASTTAQVSFDGTKVAADRRIGDEGQGFAIAMSALDTGRLGIAACAVGIGQAALDVAVSYAKQRQQFGRPIAEFQGLSFMLADMATAVVAARELYLSAARLKDAGRPFSTQASMAKLFATDAAMQVTTDAIQVLGGAGYTKEYPVERYFREVKALQIVEGTNQIQRMVIGRSLTRD